ncbi:uncharacterized protein LOC142743497 [Rhinoderma darwinii]|uniref:uncharacterized protein LOC142743497 n=1 Tax=Rhinoderma darwinii TaxID=43563 RepID=UPI003F66666E
MSAFLAETIPEPGEDSSLNILKNPIKEEELQTHPNLWDKGATGYSDRYARGNSWLNICKALYPAWNSLSASEQRRIEEDVKKRWKSVRDRFLKVLRKTERSGGSPSKRVKVPHHDELLFILPSRGQRPTEGNYQEDEGPATQDEQQQMEREPTPSTSTHYEAEGEEELTGCLLATEMSLGEETHWGRRLQHDGAPPVATQVSDPAPPTCTSSTRGRSRTPRVTDRQLQVETETLSFIQRVGADDRFDLFGHALASSCCQLPTERRGGRLPSHPCPAGSG